MKLKTYLSCVFVVALGFGIAMIALTFVAAELGGVLQVEIWNCRRTCRPIRAPAADTQSVQP